MAFTIVDAKMKGYQMTKDTKDNGVVEKEKQSKDNESISSNEKAFELFKERAISQLHILVKDPKKLDVQINEYPSLIVVSASASTMIDTGRLIGVKGIIAKSLRQTMLPAIASCVGLKKRIHFDIADGDVETKITT